VTCSFADGVLRIGAETDLDESVVVRSGSEIQVLGGKVFGREPKPVDCAGLTPTVSNTDTVLLDEAPNVDEGGAEIDLSGGRFAPGKTPEADGSGEIEITVRLNGDEGYAEVVGGPARDALQLPAVVRASCPEVVAGTRFMPAADSISWRVVRGATACAPAGVVTTCSPKTARLTESAAAGARIGLSPTGTITSGRVRSATRVVAEGGHRS
jgi:hypothetical protein